MTYGPRRVIRSDGWRADDRSRNAALEAIGAALAPGETTERALTTLESIAASLEALATPPPPLGSHILEALDRERVRRALEAAYWDTVGMEPDEMLAKMTGCVMELVTHG